VRREQALGRASDIGSSVAYAEVVKPSGCLSTAGDDPMYAARLTIILPTGR